MITATEIQRRWEAGLERFKPIERAFVVYAHATVARALRSIFARSLGCPIKRHARSGSIRGRKARLMASGHPKSLPKIEAQS